ncbi:hypothetical protein CDQ92_11470 [Sphingopyxis bauzanensis]|uniref:Type VI secretion system (T6SS) effector Tae4 (Amidase) n=1 Tax=Sphingopyxis bauzanensis TaxID=651663 RepID=A0A246JRH0_9SPHN|nr:T6SS effector amidase Tae4 family protein [Sphingopyxis bauzanensis]OWQ95446.1 hypothetical protein CDQ92_11470 [Sphingopyxis bauzanensis]GGJ53042.1 hypothetical protein GCM10011393_24090 [Sphingopyxis bauzanensis]
MPISFKSLKDAYPIQPKPDLFTALGGEWPTLVDNPAYANTCAIRLSVALKGAGSAIPGKYKEAIEGDGSPIVVKVKTFRDLVIELFGKSYWGMSKSPGTPVGLGTIPKRSGILVYHAAWKDATGHFDLWTGTGFVGAGNFQDVADGYDLELWAID